MSVQSNPSFRASQSQSYFRPANQNSRGGLAGLGLSSMNLFDDDRTLPMYKDKPYFSPRRTAPRRGLKRILSVLGLCTLVLLGYYYYRPDLPSWHGSDSEDTGAELWKWSQTLDSASKGSVDWTARRDKVREAFMVSWESYEKEAWGKAENISRWSPIRRLTCLD